MLSGSGKDQVSEQFLVASLQATRQSVTDLDAANRELLDALSDAQDEILRLSTAGKELKTKYDKQYVDLQACIKESNELKNRVNDLATSDGIFAYYILISADKNKPSLVYILSTTYSYTYYRRHISTESSIFFLPFLNSSHWFEYTTQLIS